MNNFSTKEIELQAQILLSKILKLKKKNEKTIENLKELKQIKKAENLENCSEFVYISEIDNKAKITNANFCRERLCAVCAWRRQSKFVAQTNELLEYAKQYNLQYIFMTLTIKNTQNPQETVTKLLKAWDKMSRRKFFKSAICGYIRSLEMTYNANSEDYHPHLHVLCAVRNNYYQSNEYIKMTELREAWAKALEIEVNHEKNIPNVDLRSVSFEDEKKAVLETLKYSLKSSQYTVSKEVTEMFIKALTARRLISFGGILKEIRKTLKMTDIDEIDESLTNIEYIEKKYPTILFRLCGNEFIKINF